ncbi:MAG: sugar-binding protein [Syntrophomonadaceae bacterium]
MKKAFIILVLVLAMCSSLLAGTMANYTISLDNFASGSVVGKEFIFLESGTDTFQDDIKIAPTETIIWQFAVKNYDGNLVTETDLYYNLAFDVIATPGKSAIDPLIIKIKDGAGTVVGTVQGTGTLDVEGSFPLSETGQSASYTVEIYWPSNDETDINYAGHNFGTTINVSAAASQLPFGGGEVDPPEPPEPSGIAVLFEAGKPWDQSGVDKYYFYITITNNTAEMITNWEIEFLLNDIIDSYYEARGDYSGLPVGQYRFLHPQFYNQDIPSGGSVQFNGIINGTGNTPITSVKVNNQNAEVTCEYNVIF